MSSRVSLFRGEPRHVWIRRLEQRGWPSAVAAEMATFLTEKGVPPPSWAELIKDREVGIAMPVQLPRMRA